MQGQKQFYIRVPSSRVFLVMCDGQEAKNWRELMNEARQATEPELRQRWQEYRQREMLTAVMAIEPGASLDDVMGFVCSPNMEYPCPDELAAKAIVE